jgi:RND family efflux transporter MFP subunit
MIKKVGLPIAVLAVGLVLAAVLMATGPEAPKRPAQQQARLVEVVPLERIDTQVVVSAMGTAQARREVAVTAQVAGEVVALGAAMVPGGHAAAGALLARIDSRDYEFALRQRRADVAQAEQVLLLEEGQQEIARREYELLAPEVDSVSAALVLRRPQLASARSALDASRAALERAELDLDRTRVLAPFNCLVLSKHVDRGTLVNANTPIATLIGTDCFWIEVTVPQEKLRWIAIPGKTDGPGSRVRIHQSTAWKPGLWREGRVLRLLADLEPRGRMARLLVEVDDPLALRPEHQGAPPLLVNAFVAVEILGREINDVVRVPRQYVHQGSTVWLRGPDGRLEIRTVTPVHVGEEEILVAAGLEGGELLVTSEIAAPVAGMPLRVSGEASGPKAPTGERDPSATPEGGAGAVPAGQPAGEGSAR